MRDIDDAGDAEDQRQAGGDKEQAGGGRQPVERLEQECGEGHIAAPQALFPSPLAGEGGSRAAISEREPGEGSELTAYSDPSPASLTTFAIGRRIAPGVKREVRECEAFAMTLSHKGRR